MPMTPKISVAPIISSPSPTPVSRQGKSTECIQGRWHRLSAFQPLQTSHGTWGKSLDLSEHHFLTCSMRWCKIRLIRHYLSKMASRQEACNKWWLLMNVCSLTRWSFSFAFPAHLPSCSWIKHQFEDGHFFLLTGWLAHAALKKR